MTRAAGVHRVPEVEYHRDPALSYSGMKLLLPPSCPAKYRWAMDNPPKPKPHFDEGHVVHALVLGEGADIVQIDADDWRSKTAREERDQAHTDGKTPILRGDYQRCEAMAAAVRADRAASLLFRPGTGMPEASLFWTDDETGVDLRARLDWLPEPTPGGRLIVPDLKTADTANPDRFCRKAADYGYHIQHAVYCDAVRAAGIDDDPAFLFVVVEKDPPHVVTVGEFRPEDVKIGRRLARDAIRVYAKCAADDYWPGYATDVVEFALPSYYTRSFQ